MAGTLTIAIRLELLRRDYKALSRIPITLTLLVHVICKKSDLRSGGLPGGEPAMPKVTVYDKAIEMMLAVDVFKTRFGHSVAQGSSRAALRQLLQCIAFANRVVWTARRRT